MTLKERKRPLSPNNLNYVALTLLQGYSHARVRPSAAAKKAKKPSATRRLEDELDDVADEPFDVLDEPFDVPDEPDVVETGVAVATAPTPPVTGPESERGVSFEPRAFAAATNAA
jgi:hypothetical protein